MVEDLQPELCRGRWGGRSGSEVLIPSPAGFPLSATERVNGLQSKETELHHADDAWARTLMLGEVFFVIIIIIIIIIMLVEKKVEQVIRFEGNICMYWELL